MSHDLRRVVLVGACLSRPRTARSRVVNGGAERATTRSLLTHPEGY
jgi:hypothetical protein